MLKLMPKDAGDIEKRLEALRAKLETLAKEEKGAQWISISLSKDEERARAENQDR